jgi:hypothetical protein
VDVNGCRSSAHVRQSTETGRGMANAVSKTVKPYKNFIKKRGNNMKKSLKKVALTCAAATALMAAMSISALAADSPTVGKPSVDDTTGVATVTVSGKVDANKQATILVLKPGATEVTEDTIAYIDQAAADAEGNYTFTAKFNTTGVEGNKYTVKVGGQDQPTVAEGDINIDGEDPGDIVLGDIDGKDGVTATDAGMALDAAVGKRTLDDRQIQAADVDKKDGVTATDAGAILDAAVGKRTLQ